MSGMIGAVAMGVIEAAALTLPELRAALPALARAFSGGSTPEDIATMLNTTLALENLTGARELAVGAADQPSIKGIIT